MSQRQAPTAGQRGTARRVHLLSQHGGLLSQHGGGLLSQHHRCVFGLDGALGVWVHSTSAIVVWGGGWLTLLLLVVVHVCKWW